MVRSLKIIKRALLPQLFLFCILVRVHGGTTMTRSFYSDLLQAENTYSVIAPRNYTEQKRYPVLYLLHCAGCCRSNSLYDNYQNVDALIDSFDFLIVIPQGAKCMGKSYFCWWIDSPQLPEYQYSSFLTQELKSHVDSSFPTLPQRCNTGITGHSMGGFGALHNIKQHPDVFAAAFSIKGGLDVSWPVNPNWPNSFNFKHLLDTSDSFQWENVNILSHIDPFIADSIHIGLYNAKYDPWFSDENARFHDSLNARGKTHIYWEENEYHYNVPPAKMMRVLSFFDSLFCIGNSAGRPAQRFFSPDRSRPNTTYKSTRSGSFATLTGRIGSRKSLFTAQGCYLNSPQKKPKLYITIRE